MRGFFDSDVIIDYLQGIRLAHLEWDRYDVHEVSVMTWIEVLTGGFGTGSEPRVREFLGTLVIHPLTPEIAEESVRLRVTRRLRLPDAVIWATAIGLAKPLITRNTRDFPASERTVRIPYTLN